MSEAEFRSPREEVTTDDYSSSENDSQPSTSDYSPDRNQQHPRVPSPLAPADQRNLSHQRRLSIPMLGLKLPGKNQPHAQPPTLPAPVSQPAADTAPDTAPSGSAAIPVLQLTKSLSRNTDSFPDQPAPGRSLSRLHSQRNSSRQSPRLLYTVQLASAALSVNAPTLQRPEFKQLSRLEAVRQHCATELGIRQSAIRLYQLQEVTELTESCVQLAIAVEGSDFTLASYETMVQQNKEVNTANQQCSASIKELRQKVEEQHQDLSRKSYSIAELEADKRRLQDQFNRLQQDNDVMRVSLQRADLAQQDGQKRLRELTADFNRMNADFMQPALRATSDSEGPVSRAGSLVKGSLGIQAVHSLQPTSSLLADARLVAVLERIGDPQYLASMEHLLDRLPKGSEASSPHSTQRHVKTTFSAQRNHAEHRD